MKNQINIFAQGIYTGDGVDGFTVAGDALGDFIYGEVNMDVLTIHDVDDFSNGDGIFDIVALGLDPLKELANTIDIQTDNDFIGYDHSLETISLLNRLMMAGLKDVEKALNRVMESYKNPSKSERLIYARLNMDDKLLKEIVKAKRRGIDVDALLEQLDNLLSNPPKLSEEHA